ncbi:MAG: nucleotidyltransferase domain-containing protein [Dyadobacter sp.]|uniref:nucleotidyltransferase family protein n=1 Tax=Dyadobacter sp. TaxID=1914288 RepID=UPI00326587AC
MKWLEKYQAEIVVLCKTYKVKRLYAFGSVLTENFNDESDIDLIVDFFDLEVENYADNYFDFKFGLQDVFERRVDLLEERGIRSSFLIAHLNLSKKLIYENLAC